MAIEVIKKEIERLMSESVSSVQSDPVYRQIVEVTGITSEVSLLLPCDIENPEIVKGMVTSLASTSSAFSIANLRCGLTASLASTSDSALGVEDLERVLTIDGIVASDIGAAAAKFEITGTGIHENF